VKKEFIPGWALMAALAYLATLAGNLVEIKGKHPLEAAVIAIIVGILLRNLKLLPKVFDAGIKAFEKPLILGIILYGAGLNLKELSQQGVPILATILITMSVGFFAIYFLARALKLPPGLSTLLAVGTTICGGSAIAITSPLIKAKEEETSYAVTTIALWGLVAILVYPLIAKALNVNDRAFGIFAGTAIHSTAQVVGAGYIYSDVAGDYATAIKLVRNCFMVPLAFVIAIVYTRIHSVATAEKGVKINVAKAFPWFLFGFFVMAILGTKGFFTKEVGLNNFKTWANFLILMGMAGIGMNARLSSFKGIGVKPFIVGLIGAVIVAGVSLALICGLHLY